MTWIVYRRTGYGGLPLFERAELVSRSPKQARLANQTGYAERIAAEQILAEFDDEPTAHNLHTDLLAIRGEYEQRVREARESGLAKIAQAIEARRVATGNTDAVADESAVPKECAQGGPA